MLNQRKIDDAFVTEAVNNMGYVFKNEARQFIQQFLSKQTAFRPFDAMRSDNQGNLKFFIELRGFIQIGDNYSHQMIIGLPVQYPQCAPIFLLSVNRAVFAINREAQMLNNKEIFIEKDQNGIQYIRFNFPFLSYSWKAMTRLTATFDQLRTILNSPPILVSISSIEKENKKNLPQNANVKRKSVQINQPGLEPSQLMQLVDAKSIQLSNTFSTLQQLQEHRQKLEYVSIRNSYILNDHASDLISSLKAKSNELKNKTQQLTKSVEENKAKRSCDEFLAITQKDQEKLQRLVEREALKQAEKRLNQCMQKELQCGNKKYSDYKRIVRTLFSQMFDNQSKILQSAD